MTIRPNDVANVDLGPIIANKTAPLTSEFGSLVLRYTAPVERALSAAVMIQLPGTPIEFHLDAFPKAPKAMTGGREGIWWLPREFVKDSLVLANTSDSAFSAVLTLYESNGKSLLKKLALGPRQTTRLSVLSMVQEGGLVDSFGGISVDAGLRAADLDSAHFIYDEANGFLALMKMFDRDSNATVRQRSLTSQEWTIRAPMLPLTNPDPALGLPAGTTLKPAVFLRNASSKAYTARVTFNWRSGTMTGKRMLAVPMQPHATARLDVAALQANGTIPATAQWAYVNISAPIKPDDLLAVATSFDATLRFGAQTPFTDQAANHWAGGIWEADPNHNTLITIGNAGNIASKVQIGFYYNSGLSKYLLERTLGPDEQAWIDVGQLIGNQVPDANGKTIPPGVMSGSYDVNGVSDKPTDGLFEGKLVVDKTFGYAVHGCLNCCPTYDPIDFTQDPLYLAVGGKYLETVVGTNTCTNQVVSVPASNWMTGNQNVAILDAPGDVKGQGAGSTTLSATYQEKNPNSKDECVWTTAPLSGTVNVASAAASVTLRAANNEQVSSTDGASTLYKGFVGSLNLGIISGKWGVNNNGCIAGSELVGAVTPNTFTGSVTVKRTVVSEGCWQGSTSVSCQQPGLGDDTGTWITTNPQAVTPGGNANGNVYNLDAPGIWDLQNTSTPVRVRFNFAAYAVGPDGTTQISPTINYFVRLSCKNNSSGVAQLQTDASSSDNQTGLGTTNTTWNLK